MSYSSALLSPAWFALVTYAVLVQTAGVAFKGFLRPLGDAGGTDGRMLAYIAFMSATATKLCAGVLIDRIRRYMRCCTMLLFATLGAGLGFLTLASQVSTVWGARVPSTHVLWVGVLWTMVCCDFSVLVVFQFIRAYFDSKMIGFISGARAFLVSFSNLAFTVAFLQEGGESDAPWAAYDPALRASAVAVLSAGACSMCPDGL